MATLRLALLGSPTIAHADVACTFPTRKALALVIYLAVEGGSHSRDKLAALFWPDSDRPHGRAMLRYTLTSLRRALSETTGAGPLGGEGAAIGLDFQSGLQIDVRALEGLDLTALQHAAEFCRGDFLEGFTL